VPSWLIFANKRLELVDHLARRGGDGARKRRYRAMERWSDAGAGVRSLGVLTKAWDNPSEHHAAARRDGACHLHQRRLFDDNRRSILGIHDLTSREWQPATGVQYSTSELPVLSARVEEWSREKSA
jgi:hypothetical protein